MKKTLVLIFILLILPVAVYLLYQPLGSYNTNTKANSTSRGQLGDTFADIVIGKPNFSEIVPNFVTANKFFYPRSVIVDRSVSPNRLFIFDGSNSRIVGIKNLDKCTSESPNCLVDPSQGDIVIGQPNFFSAACNGDSGFQNYPTIPNASAATLCNLPVPQLSVAEHGDGSSMFVSSIGDLYVNDMENHRVLKYIKPFETDTLADEVWGQNDFTGNKCNKGGSTPDATSLCFGWSGNNNWTAGVDIDSQGNLWVADSKNNRVLRFPNDSKTADLVLGQTGFNSNAPGSNLNQLNSPAAVRVNSQGVVYVADYQNGRILRFANLQSGATGEKFGPNIDMIDGLDFNPSNPGKIWVAKKQEHIFDLIDEANGQAVRTLGVPGNGNILNNVSGSIGIDSSGNYYIGVPGGDYGNDVVYYPNSGPFDIPSKRLFNGKHVINSRNAKGIVGGSGVVIAGNQLVVQDSGARILFWNELSSLASGKAADGILETTDFGSSAENIRGAGGLVFSIQASDNYLYVARGRHDKPVRIEMYKLPLISGQQPLTAYLSYPFNVLGGGQINMKAVDASFWGLYPATDDSYLWVSHSDTNRVFRIRNPLTNPIVDVLLGQNDLTGNSCNRGGAPRSGATVNSLCFPGSIAEDRLGNLYVSDHSLEIQGNMRLLIFSGNLFPVNNPSLILSPDATYIKNNVATWQPAFDSQNRMLVGYNPYWTPNPKGGWFPGVYNNPLSDTSVPDSYLSDYYSLAISADFDSQDNLYVGDGDRSRVLIYKQPFGSSASLPTATPVPTLPSVLDSIPPSVSITTPVNGTVFSRNTTINIVASASDNVEVTKVEFLIGGVVKCVDTLTPYTCTWKIPSKPNTSYTISTKAYDKALNVSTSNNVTVRSGK